MLGSGCGPVPLNARMYKQILATTFFNSRAHSAAYGRLDPEGSKSRLGFLKGFYLGLRHVPVGCIVMES